MTEQQMRRIEIAGQACERCLRAEHAALNLGDLEWAADRAEAAAYWSRLAFIDARTSAAIPTGDAWA
ncbi:hypothetical protein PQS31_00035 [Luteimonas sp BLCC-B24]|uniref:hypothetical protein n=1 Tax=Luteimonas sp. BLCC-B24 TaxID=3025317 RepID=UPI00234C6F57|nr:hypothetical protein [Luteimonas sp. BLCC-B24]MDC7805219.1 hypothetical protein [Luteimonas sp. BLCC-B24]